MLYFKLKPLSETVLFYQQDFLSGSGNSIGKCKFMGNYGCLKFYKDSYCKV